MNHNAKQYYFADNPVLVIAGPTASGKTGAALLVCEALNGEVVSADSMQIYRGMDIGTAKASREERQRIPHHLLDIRDPGQRYSVADYKNDASEAIRDIYRRGKRPVLCGGTGQYLSALIEGLSFTEIPTDLDLRQQLNLEAENNGIDSLYQKLAGIDPETASRLSLSDQKRIIRALEVFQQTGQTISQLNVASRQAGPDFCFTSYCLNHDRPVLYQRINQRVEEMIADGLADEVQKLLLSGLPPDSNCWQAIGYKEMLPYLRGEAGLAEITVNIQQATRRYAKRQLTWFRKMHDLNWLLNQSAAESAKIILKNL